MNWNTTLTKKQVQIMFAWMGFIWAMQIITGVSILLGLIIGCAIGFVSLVSIVLIENTSNNTHI